MPENLEKAAQNHIDIESLNDGLIAKLPNGLNIYKTLRQPGYPEHEIDTMIEGTDGYVVPDIPYTGLGYVVEDELLLDACRTFGMLRLQYIPQLAKLNDPDVDPSKAILADNFFHTRFLHSLDVLALASAIGSNCKLSKQQMLALQIGTLTHDVLTPAGGDTTKLIDREAFDEDAHYHTHLNHPDIQTFCDAHNIDKQAVLETVNGSGLLSDIRDFADKLAYTARDLEAFIAPVEAFPDSADALPTRVPLAEFVHQDGKVTHNLLRVWEHMEVDNGQLVCTHSEDLFNMLNVRALMFKNLYANPRARYNESLINSLLTQYLYESGVVKKEALLDPFSYSSVDSLLKDLLHEWFGIDSIDIWYNNFHPTYKVFETAQQARAFENSLLSGGNPFVRFEDASHFFKPGTHFLVKNDDGNVLPYTEHDPTNAKIIDDNGTPTDPIRVYYLDTPPELASEELKLFSTWRMGRTNL